ncbi:MAG TPA: rhodanese-like domain-containing protein [Ignavibacteriales bacterium]|nr:rhodanese-like domain-containing protein [Ignavibacteriales bacterium]
MIIKALKWFLLPSVFLFMQGCLENNLIPEFHGSIDKTAGMLTYFESHGDYINSMDAPPLVEASEVYSNESYLILDIRSRSQFQAGHIKGAVNLNAGDLLSYFRQNGTKQYSKVVLVSQAGQASSYCATLLRLAGFDNVYSLNFGMAAWNTAFAEIWISHTMNSSEMNNYTNEAGKRNSRTPLPGLEFRTKSLNIKDMIEERITDLLAEGFSENPDSTGENGPSITSESLFGNKYYYVVCYGSDALFSAVGRYNPYSGLGHPKGAVSYAPYSSLKASNFLQTLPTDKKIGIYCYNGQFSASAAAYLRLLGYDAKSMLFGANTLFYSRMLYDPQLKKYAFDKFTAVDYPYVTGN